MLVKDIKREIYKSKKRPNQIRKLVAPFKEIVYYLYTHIYIVVTYAAWMAALNLKNSDLMSKSNVNTKN